MNFQAKSEEILDIDKKSHIQGMEEDLDSCYMKFVDFMQVEIH